MNTEDDYRAHIGDRVRTRQRCTLRGYTASATGTVMGVGLFTPDVLVVHFDGDPIDENTEVQRDDVMVIHGEFGEPS